jgi:hypothetical protein
MESLPAILYATIAFNACLAIFIIYLVRKSRTRQEVVAFQRRQQLIEQGKIISAQENLLKRKRELLKEKDNLLGTYRKLLD